MKHETYQAAQAMRQRIDDLKHLKIFLGAKLGQENSLVVRTNVQVILFDVARNNVNEMPAKTFNDTNAFNTDDREALLKAIDDRIQFLEDQFAKITEE